MTSGEDVRLSKVAHGSDRWLGFPVFVRPTQNLHSESSWPNSTAGSKTLLFRRSSISRSSFGHFVELADRNVPTLLGLMTSIQPLGSNSPNA